MKQLWCAVSLLAGSLLFIYRPAQTSASGALLQQMEQASQNLNYEFAYINVSRLGIESLRYRHAVIDNRVFAQLLQMDGPRRGDPARQRHQLFRTGSRSVLAAGQPHY